MKIQQQLLFKPLKKINNGKVSLIVQDEKQKIRFFSDITFPHLNGSIFVGEITGINNNIKAAFVKFGPYQGILSFFSIHPDYLGPEGQKVKEEIQAESPTILRKSKIYQSIDFSKLLYIKQKVLVQVINIYTNKGIKLSTFISLYANGIKYNPNSLKQIVITNNNSIKTYVKLLNLQGSVITNLYKNTSIKIFELLVHKWFSIKNAYDHMVKLDQNEIIEYGDPINMLLNKFNIHSILCNSRSYILSLNHMYNTHIKYIKDTELEEQNINTQLEVLRSKKVNYNNTDIYFFNSTMGTEIVISGEKFRSYDTERIFHFITNQIIIRNIGGLIFIPIKHSSSKNILDIIIKQFKKDSVFVYYYEIRELNLTIYAISKKYRYHLIQEYHSHFSQEEDRVQLECSAFLVISQDKSTNQNVHIDVNRGKSIKSNHHINIDTIETFIAMKYNYKGIVYIDILESNLEEHKQYYKMLSPYCHIKVLPLSVIICVV